MPAPLDQVVANLQNSVGEAIAVFEEQGKQLDTARQQASGTRERFDKALEQWRDSPNAKTRILQGVERRSELGLVQDRLDASTHLSVRWEQSFCDIYHALMQLYAYPSHQNAAEEVSQIVRAIRLLQVEVTNDQRSRPRHRMTYPTKPSPPRMPPRKRPARQAMCAVHGFHGHISQSGTAVVRRENSAHRATAPRGERGGKQVG